MSRARAAAPAPAPIRMRARTLLGALCATLAMLLASLGGWGASPAQAAPAFPSGDLAIEIHKFEQPHETRPPANGLPQDTTGLAPVEGAVFAAKRVPGIDLSTDAGQREAATLTVAEASARAAGEPVAASDVTDGAGDATLAPLAAGLYLVEETLTPQGFIGAAPFLVALPLTDPVDRDRWLTAVHVYPKNARVSAALAVDDRSAVTNGDPITWTARTSIPGQMRIADYTVQSLLAAGVVLDDRFSAIDVGITGVPAPLQYGIDYTVNEATVDGRRGFEVVFAPAGLAKLEAAVAADPRAEVAVAYRAHVTGPGVHTNEVRLVIGGEALAGSSAPTKFGPLEMLVHEKGNPAHVLAGTEFTLYLSAEDALAGRNPVTVGGVDRWTSGPDGTIVIDSLRFSGFVNGLDRDSSDPLFRRYYVVPVAFPSGWTGVTAPIALTVTSTSRAEVGIVELWRSGGGGGGGELETTGARATGIAAGAALLLGLGALLVLRRRRDAAEAGARR